MFAYTITLSVFMTIKIDKIAHNIVIFTCLDDNVDSNILIIERKKEK